MAIAIGQFTINDLNDITTGTTAPSSPTVNQLWLDTSSVPNLLKAWNGTIWFKTGANSLAELDPTANQTIITHTGDISASNTAIGLKVATSTYTAKMASLDGSISGINSTLSTQTGSINVLNTSITSKVTQTDIANYVGSRGENLVTNGTALMDTNFNFTGFTLDKTDAYGSAGSFSDSLSATRFTDEFMPVNPDMAYKMSFYAKQIKGIEGKALNPQFSMLAMFDADKIGITSDNVMFIPNTLTTLATELKNGDTVVNLTDATNWKNAVGAVISQRGFIFWDYKNAGGYLYPPLTYSRHDYLDKWADGGVNFTTNVITLKVPWANGTFVAGTQVSNSSAGGTYSYAGLSNTVVPEVWTNYKGIFTGTGSNNEPYKFRSGTAYVKLGWLDHYMAGQTAITANNNKILYSNLSFAVDTATQADLTTAQTQANLAVANALTAQIQANLGVTNAGIAKTQADLGVANAGLAQGTANTAKAYTDNLMSDAVITQDEKIQLKREWDLIVVEGNPSTGKIPVQASAFAVSDTAFDTAYEALRLYLVTTINVFGVMTTPTTGIVRATWDTKWKDYYNARTDLINLISITAKTRADLGVANASTAQTQANLGVTNAGVAKTQADLGVANALTAQTQANTAITNAGLAKTQADLGVSNALTAQTQATLGVTNAGLAQTQANTATANALTAQTQATLGVTNAGLAQTTANTATTNAGTANGLLADLSNDNKITSNEKGVTLREFNGIIAEKPLNDAQATTFGITTEKTNYGTAYTTLYNYVNPLMTNLALTEVIVGTTFRANFSDYYTKRTTLLNAIAVKAKTLADTAQTQANTATTSASTAQTQANLGVTNASTAQTKADLGVANALTAQTQANLGVTNAGLAQTKANVASQAITDMSNDNILTPVEKAQLKKEWAVMVAEKPTYDALATTYAITTEKTNYGTAYTNLDTPLNNVTNGYFLTMLVNTTIVGTTFRALFDDYYDKKALLISRINQTAKTRADLGVTNAGLAQTQATLGVTNASLAQTQANLGVTNAGLAKTQADLGVANALTAQTQATLGVTNAGLAQTKANSATQSITDMSNDAILTPVEKTQLKKEWAVMVAEKPTYNSLATTYAITTENTNYNTAYTNLDTPLNNVTNGYLLTMTANTPIVGATFRALFDDYYDKKALLIKKVNETGKTRADLGVANALTAQTQANLGVTNAGVAKTQADLGVTNAGVAKTQADLGVTNASTAQTKANDAQNGADDASSRLDTAESTIIQTVEDIASKVSSETYDALEGVVTGHTTFINQVDDMITTSVSSIKKTADDNGTAIEEMKTYMQFDASGLVLGQDGGTNDNLKVKISNSKMSFLDNGAEVASVSGQLMTIDKAKIGTSIIVGNHTIEKYDANITILRWIG